MLIMIHKYAMKYNWWIHLHELFNLFTMKKKTTTTTEEWPGRLRATMVTDLNRKHLIFSIHQIWFLYFTDDSSTHRFCIPFECVCTAHPPYLHIYFYLLFIVSNIKKEDVEMKWNGLRNKAVSNMPESCLPIHRLFWMWSVLIHSRIHHNFPHIQFH